MSSLRRSPIACDDCRARKRKCDGQDPCGPCANKRVACSYSAIGHTSEDRLRSKELLQTSLSQNYNATGPVAANDGSRAESVIPPTSLLSNSAHKRALHLKIEDDRTLPPLTIPIGHKCTNDSLLMLPQVRALIGNYPEDFFFRVESQRQLPPTQTFNPIDNRLELPQVDQETALSLKNSFFKSIHLVNPFLDEAAFAERYLSISESRVATLNEQAVVLVVYALGAISGKSVNEEDIPGMDLFKPAFHILTTSWTTCFSGDILLAQGLVLCSLYLCYLAQPLRAWKVIHMASTTVQQLLIKNRNVSLPPLAADALSRVAWSCFLIESDLLSEFHQPRSGIEQMVDDMTFPGHVQAPTPMNLAFLADITIRLLLNRAHYSMYSENPWIRPLDSSLHTICHELYRQLRVWHDSLPSIIKPDLSSSEDSNQQSYILRLRYWSAKDILFRPFVVYAISLPSAQALSQSILDKCELCLSSCRNFIFASERLLSQYTSYTYSALHTCFGATLLLSLAAMSPVLQRLVPDILELQTFAIARLRPWAKPGTNIECALNILSSLQIKLCYQ